MIILLPDTQFYCRPSAVVDRASFMIRGIIDRPRIQTRELHVGIHGVLVDASIGADFTLILYSDSK